jgi:predicted AAA+ superfamily ATPase
MALPSLFDMCIPRDDVRTGTITESDFAADLAQVLRGNAPDEYKNAAKFFAKTHPTRGLRDLLHNVCHRLNGSGAQAASIFRLDTNYGGGKTHALIALTHVAKGMQGVANVTKFVDKALLPCGRMRTAAFDGENADPPNGRPLGDGLRAYTPWGELAYALAGKAGYETVRRSDESGAAPGAETLQELFGGEPTLILCTRS